MYSFVYEEMYGRAGKERGDAKRANAKEERERVVEPENERMRKNGIERQQQKNRRM